MYCVFKLELKPNKQQKDFILNRQKRYISHNNAVLQKIYADLSPIKTTKDKIKLIKQKSYQSNLRKMFGSYYGIGSIESQLLISKICTAVIMATKKKTTVKPYQFSNHIPLMSDNKSSIMFDVNNLSVQIGLIKQSRKGNKEKNSYIVVPVKYPNNHLKSKRLLDMVQKDLAKIKIVEINQKTIKGKTRFFLHLTVESDVDLSENAKLTPAQGIVGIDPGISAMAVVSDRISWIYELAPHSYDYLCTNIHNIKKLQQKLDRQRRINNPENYNDDGTCKEDVKWNVTKNMIKTQNKINQYLNGAKELRKNENIQLAKSIIQNYGNHIKVESMNYKGLQSRTKKTEISSKTGRYKSKKRFGSSIAHRSPSTFLTVLKNMAINTNGEYDSVRSNDIKASQFNHLTGEYIKPKLSQRSKKIGNDLVQRDLYSAYLIKNSYYNEDDKKYCIDINECLNGFEAFLSNSKDSLMVLQNSKRNAINHMLGKIKTSD